MLLSLTLHLDTKKNYEIPYPGKEKWGLEWNNYHDQLNYNGQSN